MFLKKGIFLARNIVSKFQVMTRIAIKRVYEPEEASDGFRVLVDKLWPRGIRKEALPFDLWAKEITPSAPLRKWFHGDPQSRWEAFRKRYLHELESSADLHEFIGKIDRKPRVTLLYASKNAKENHALVLKEFLERNLR